MKKIKKFKKLKPITIEIEKQGSEQDKHPDWMMEIIEAVASLEKEKPKKKKTADELFEDLGFEKRQEEGDLIRYERDGAEIIIMKLTKDYCFLPHSTDGSKAYWVTAKLIKAIRRKAKEMGWR